MTAGLRLLPILFTLAAAPALATDWQPAETVETYSVSGNSGIELYRSIGERGPQVGIGRAIAYTTFKLTWTRDYQPSGSGCTLVSARPKLTLIYRLPKLSGKLPAATQALWDTFIAGIRAHERAHGDFIVDMTKATQAATVGLSVDGDPGCKKIRKEVAARALAASEEQRRRGRDFDKVEMSDGGNVHQLILALVNGDRKK